MEHETYWLAWHIILAGQAHKFWTIMDYFGTPENAWLAEDREFSSLPTPRVSNHKEMLQRRRDCDLSKIAYELERQDCKTIFYADPDYPRQLENI